MQAKRVKNMVFKVLDNDFIRDSHLRHASGVCGNLIRGKADC